MKIGFDAKRITHNGTGLGNYGRAILNALTYNYPENNYLLYTPGRGKENLREQIIPSPSISFRYPKGIYKGIPSVWRSMGIISDLRKDKPDLYHGLSNELPLNIKKSRIPSVVSIHDLIFLRYPHLYKPIDRKIYNYKFQKAGVDSDRIIAISKQTKRDIISYYKIKEEKIDIIYNRCDKSFYQKISTEKKEEIKQKYTLTAPFILYVGSIEERKNLLLVVKALKDLKEDITLVAIGRRTTYMSLIELYIKENNLQHRVRLLTGVPFGDLPAFYQMANLFVYPSFFEGFGIPILEALVSDTPVIGATGSCLEEAGGPGSLYTDPYNADELRGLIEMVLRDQKLADSMRRQGQEYAKLFSYETLADELMNVYRNVL